MQQVELMMAFDDFSVLRDGSCSLAWLTESGLTFILQGLRGVHDENLRHYTFGSAVNKDTAVPGDDAEENADLKRWLEITE
jgi:hypothetical protein